ncbi:MAG: leucine--tRNA ligase [Acidobacteriota bacterium]|nr:leucine--tRNA ligase [Acidobacteriota bacterium]
MDEKYFAKKIERKWQKRWAERGTFEARIVDNKEKFYCLEMLPYPSGKLHMGHVRNYSIGDVLSWYKRLQGFNVLHPIGWDSFGQPAEQAAIKQNVNPRDWTEKNIVQMREQLQSLGLSYDWSREIAAHRPEYYKFDQWFFLKMLEMGLAYRKDSEVNWCPKCETTLSNEQASGGICWRCGTQVEKQSRPQWFLRITKYAEELLKDMSEIEDGWAERVLTMQRNWINKSVGANIRFQIANFKYRDKELTEEKVSEIEIFTTRIDTIYGVNAVVVSPDHPFVVENFGIFSDEVKSKIEEIRVEQTKPKDYDEEIVKDGIDTGMKAVNPFSSEEIPIWVGNYVMMSYGTGAVMSVPAHDERDFEFAKKFNLPIRQVIEDAEMGRRGDGKNSEQSQIANRKSQINEAFTGKGILINSDKWNGRKSKEAIREMTKFAEDEGFGESATTYRLRDWGISRQRFWGSPIPIIYCDSCGAVPVPFENLPVELPDSAPFTGVGESPLAKVPEFVNTNCPKCGEDAKRETDTMDTFVDSSWYYFRYCDPHNTEMPFDPKIINYWMPVEQYIGGIDHAVMHLLYTRFWTKVCHELGLVDFVEPAKRLLTQGMVVTDSFYSTTKESYVAAEDVEIERDVGGEVLSAKLKSDGSAVKIAVEKMGKSKLNGIDPNEMIHGKGADDGYGADSVRLFSMFAAPVENELVWQETGIEGAKRFIQRVWRYVFKWKMENGKWKMPESVLKYEFSDDAKKLRQKTHQTIQRITENFESGQFNTPVAALMELSNAMYDFKVEPENANDGDLFAVREACESLILMLAPYAPHVAEELWEVITGRDSGILESDARFPIANEEVAKEDEVEIAVQINGKLRARVKVSADASQDELEKAALENEKIKEYTNEKEIVKIIVVPDRLVNVVIKS